MGGIRRKAHIDDASGCEGSGPGRCCSVSGRESMRLGGREPKVDHSSLASANVYAILTEGFERLHINQMLSLEFVAHDHAHEFHLE